VVHTGKASQLWQAYDDGKQRMAAVKSLLEDFAKDGGQIRYLRQEYAVGREVVHPRVIEVYAFDTDRGIPYLASQWFAAPNLKKWIHNKEDRRRLACQIPTIIEQAAEGLGCLHHHGWIHRDIKPENFLAKGDGQVKLIDFGLAQRAKRGWARFLSFRSKRQGTPSYMSPEQIRGTTLDLRADVYSFGCTVHELLVGVPPFTGSTREELFGKHLKVAPPSLEAMDHNLTSEFAQLVRRCLAKDPDARPASAEVFLEEFRRLRVFKVPPAASEQAGS
jgi:serine/threonine protein kinase